MSVTRQSLKLHHPSQYFYQLIIILTIDFSFQLIHYFIKTLIKPFFVLGHLATWMNPWRLIY